MIERKVPDYCFSRSHGLHFSADFSDEDKGSVKYSPFINRLRRAANDNGFAVIRGYVFGEKSFEARAGDEIRTEAKFDPDVVCIGYNGLVWKQLNGAKKILDSLMTDQDYLFYDMRCVDPECISGNIVEPKNIDEVVPSIPRDFWGRPKKIIGVDHKPTLVELQNFEDDDMRFDYFDEFGLSARGGCLGCAVARRYNIDSRIDRGNGRMFVVAGLNLFVNKEHRMPVTHFLELDGIDYAVVVPQSMRVDKKDDGRGYAQMVGPAACQHTSIP